MRPQCIGRNFDVEGGKQQRCNICNKKTSWVCAVCTRGPDSLWPCCPKVTRSRKEPGSVRRAPCLSEHVANPEWVPRGKKQAKRARGEATPAASESTESDEESELCDECDEE